MRNFLCDMRRGMQDFVKLTMGCLGKGPKMGEELNQGQLGSEKGGRIERGEHKADLCL